MKAEKFLLSIIAIVIGLLVAGGAFYLYQMTKTISPEDTKTVNVKSPTPTPDSRNFLIIESPVDGEVVNKKTISVSGKTLPEATVIISSSSSDQVVKPTRTGSFSATHTIDDDSTIISMTAVFPTGEEITHKRVVNFSTEEF